MGKKPVNNRALRGLFGFIEGRSTLIVVVSIGVYMVFFSTFTILLHHSFNTFAYDLGIYMQSLWTTIHGYGCFYTALWDGSRFAYHFEPVLFGILPLYAALPRAETLLVLQSVALGFGAWPVYLLARRRLGRAVGLGFALLYLLSPAVHGVNSVDFHASAIAVPLLLSSHYCLSVHRLRLGFVLAVVALTCRENVALVVFLMAAYWAWCWRRQDMLSIERTVLPQDRRFLVASGLCLAAMVWFLLSVNVAIPHFANAAAHPAFERYEGAYLNLVEDPTGKLLYLLQVFGPLGFFSFLSPGTLLMSAPAFAQNLLALEPNMYRIGNHYAALLIPGLFVAGIHGVALVGNGMTQRFKVSKYLAIGMMMLSTIAFTAFYSNSPLALGRGFPVVTEHHRVLSQVVQTVPQEAFVFADRHVFPHVCHGSRVHSMGFRLQVDFFEQVPVYGRKVVARENGDFDFVIMDTTSRWSIAHYVPDSVWDRLQQDYGVYVQVDGVYLYKRGYQGAAVPLLSD